MTTIRILLSGLFIFIGATVLQAAPPVRLWQPRPGARFKVHWKYNAMARTRVRKNRVTMYDVRDVTMEWIVPNRAGQALGQQIGEEDKIFDVVLQNVTWKFQNESVQIKLKYKAGQPVIVVNSKILGAAANKTQHLIAKYQRRLRRMKKALLAQYQIKRKAAAVLQVLAAKGSGLLPKESLFSGIYINPPVPYPAKLQRGCHWQTKLEDLGLPLNFQRYTAITKNRGTIRVTSSNSNNCTLEVDEVHKIRTIESASMIGVRGYIQLHLKTVFAKEEGYVRESQHAFESRLKFLSSSQKDKAIGYLFHSQELNIQEVKK